MRSDFPEERVYHGHYATPVVNPCNNTQVLVTQKPRSNTYTSQELRKQYETDRANEGDMTLQTRQNTKTSKQVLRKGKHSLCRTVAPVRGKIPFYSGTG